MGKERRKGETIFLDPINILKIFFKHIFKWKNVVSKSIFLIKMLEK